jgi:peptidyl-prolyl cis-trans isomerase A (cyclophilin A)
MPRLSGAFAALISVVACLACHDTPPTLADGGPLPAALLDPSLDTATAPAMYFVAFDTSKGTFTVQVTRAWAPKGADRFYNLVEIGFFDGARFFRVVNNFMAQFGLNGVPAVDAKWKDATIADDPVVQSNTRGFVSFATAGPNTRTTQVFVNFGNNATLDGSGFAPFGQVTSGMDVVDMLNSQYGDATPAGSGPTQARIESDGNAYLAKDFPDLDYVKSAKVL